MADPSSSRPGRTSLPDEPIFDSDEEPPRKSSASTRRRSHYADHQRVSRSTRPSTAETSKSAGKRASYPTYPPTYWNPNPGGDETVPPPVDPNAWKSQHPPTPLEASLRAQSRSRSAGARTRSKSDTARRRRSAPPQGQQELTELAGPPPVPPKPREEAAARAGAQQNLPERDVITHPADFPAPPDDDDEDGDAGREVSRAVTELYTVSYLIFFAIWGTLARLGVQWITFYPGTPIVTPVIWANFGGSLIMGFLAEDQSLFRDEKETPEVLQLRKKNDEADGQDLEQVRKAAATKRKKAIPLYIGLATGFCGSFTSFSSFARDFFLALSNNLPTPIDHPYFGQPPSISSTANRNGGYSFEAFLHIIIFTLAISLGGLIAGAQLAAFAAPYTPRIHGRFVRNIVDPLAVALGWGCWFGAVMLAILTPKNVWRGEAVFAIVFAPLGCLLRYYAGVKLNGLVPAFPLGTFVVNMFGTAVEGMCFDIQHVRVGVMGRLGGGVVGCQVLQGVMDGFCGALTTVSTWVAEINGLKRKHGWGYAFGSVVGALSLLLIIMGSVRWTVGYSDPVCDTGYTSKVHG